ncbi:sigma 54-interacting transcriptional regulator [Sorangium sp. So ce131]|uniref:sigma 54-interacting transcriptional regulator n=1 Tax=Sorangium sp. So ce131 TaxID=3133282 RepID=UPI003F60A927
MTPAEGNLLARRYRLLRPLGRGGLATAWLARDEALGREICLKLLGHACTAERAAFRGEFRMLAGLFHPHLVRVHDFGMLRETGEPRFYFTSEAILGAPLDEHVKGRRFEEARGAIVDVLDALRFLHRARIRHGDVKPANILVDAAGRAVLIDLSCAARIGRRPGGAVSGTQGYLAPEVVRGEPADGRADLFSLGRTLRAIAPLLSEPLPDVVGALVERLLQPEPRDRPADAGEVLDWVGASPRAVAPPPPEPPHLVGREAEVRAIAEALAALEQGKSGPRLVVIAGEPGCGKSRLLREAKWSAELRVATVEGFARAASPVASMLGRATGEEALPAGALGALRAHERLVAAGAQPVVLALDDADEVSGTEREMLEALVRLLGPEDPVLLIAAERVAQAGSRAPLAAVAAEAGRSVREVPLPPLGREAVQRWMADIGMGEATEAVLRASAGWPADLVVTAGRLAESGDVGQLDATTPGASARYALRLRGLRGPLRDAVAALAVQGGAAADEELPSLGLPAAQLAELAARGVATRAAGGWVLTRAGPIAALLEALGGDVVRAAHARAAAALTARLGGGGPAAGPTQVAAAGPTQVADAGPTQVAAADPTQVADAGPTQVAAADPTRVAPAPTQVAAADPTRVAPAPTQVAAADPTRVAPAPTQVAAADPTRVAPAPTQVAAADPTRVAPTPTQVAAAAAKGSTPTAFLAPRAILHLALSGDGPAAERLFLERRADRDADPRAWAAAAEALLEAVAAPETRLEIASTLQRGGRAARAREVLERLLAEDRADPAGRLGARRAQALARLGACLLELGDPTAALAHVEEAAAATSAPRERAALADLASRALLRLGSHAEARARAEPALASCDDPEVLASLHEDVGVAASYLGERRLAGLHLGLAAGLHRDRRAPRSLVRALSYQAIDAFRAGEVEAALTGYRQALATAEEHGLGDLVARCSLNVGTACHQSGELGEALAAYERGARLASALGQADLVLVLDFDLAKLWADVGAFERAARVAARVEAEAARRGAPFFAAAAASVLGDCALAAGDAEEAARCFERSRRGFEAQGAQREVVEEELELCRAHLARGALDDARAALARARAQGAALEAPDLGARTALLEGRLVLLDGERGDDPADDGRAHPDDRADVSRISAARERLGRALDLAERAAQPDLVADVRLALAAVEEAAGEPAAAAAQRDRAAVAWTAMARSLPEPLQHAFWMHPRRRAAQPSPAAALAGPPGGPPAGPASIPASGIPASIPASGIPASGIPASHAHHAEERAAKLERLLAMFRKLNSSVEIADILAMAMDAAIDLTAAERGFLLLEQPGGELRVAVARNVDREKVGRSHLKFSYGIAERAIAAQEPVVTVDAQEDERFREHASVHAMRLRSVIAVPIRSPDGVLGALYLDNRFRRARFAPDDVDLLLAFADQLALALRNARLVEDLRRRTDELEAERRRVEELLRGQAAEIGRLQEEVLVRQQALEHRYDYGAIVGRGAALRAVFATLDRVVDTPVSVLVTGESGTGKELVARAIHFAGPRKGGPFMGINCAALPAALLESELFGHVRGAFTGADRDRTGLVVAARGGTLFLDELGEMPLEVQAKLLRVLQEREVRPVGSAEAVRVDFRLVCATNRDLLAETARGRFREDLYYRVAVVQIRLPPLRDRLEDLPELALHFVRRAAEQLGRPTPQLSREALRRLGQHSWPGNVRELENVITKAVVLCDGRKIGPDDVDLPRAPGRGAHGRGAPNPLRDERAAILGALDRTGWNAVQAAREAGMSRATFYRKLRQLGIERPR